MDLVRIAARVAADDDKARLQAGIEDALSKLQQPVSGSPKSVSVPGFDDFSLVRFDPAVKSPTWGEVQLYLSLRGNLKNVYQADADSFDAAAAAEAGLKAAGEHADVLKSRKGWTELVLQYGEEPSVSDDDGSLSEQVMDLFMGIGCEVSNWESDAMRVECPKGKAGAAKKLLADIQDGKHGPELAGLMGTYSVVQQRTLKK